MGDDNDERDARDVEMLSDYAALVSYGGDVDFYTSSAYNMIPPDANPIFGRHVLWWLISVLLLKPLCCGVFYLYFVTTHELRFLMVGIIVTFSHYLLRVITVVWIWYNVSQDKLPLSRLQQAVIGGITGSLALISLTLTCWELFYRPGVIRHLLPVSSSDAETVVPTVIVPKTHLDAGAVTILLILATSLLVVTTLWDMLSFLMPRLWALGIFKTWIAF